MAPFMLCRGFLFPHFFRLVTEGVFLKIPWFARMLLIVSGTFSIPRWYRKLRLLTESVKHLHITAKIHVEKKTSSITMLIKATIGTLPQALRTIDWLIYLPRRWCPGNVTGGTPLQPKGPPKQSKHPKLVVYGLYPLHGHVMNTRLGRPFWLSSHGTLLPFFIWLSARDRLTTWVGVDVIWCVAGAHARWFVRYTSMFLLSTNYILTTPSDHPFHQSI